MRLGLHAVVKGVLCIIPLVMAMMPGMGKATDHKTPSVWATVPFFTWITETSDPIEQFSFFINGVQADSKTVEAVKHKESLHVRLHLAYEQQNLIEVRKLGQVVYTVDVFYAPSYESLIVPKEATYLPFHTANNEKPCRPCHRLAVAPEDYEPMQAKEQICYSCHQHMFADMKSLHKPAAIEWKCLQCHQTEERPSLWNSKQPVRFAIAEANNVATLCYRCHKKFEEKVSGYAFLHGPIGMGGCNMCHNPHSSNWPKLLENNQTTLCINCHEFRKKLSKPVIHPIIKTKGCTPCHDPHGSDYPLQLKESMPDQCTRCHPAILKQTNNHPVQNHPTFIKGAGKGKKPELSCIDCHSPHAAGFRNLLPAEETMQLCTHCHPMGAK